VLAIKVGGDAAAVEAHLKENVHGDVVAFSDEVLSQMSDSGRIRKIYRVDVQSEGEVNVSGKEAEAFVVGSMALKGS
jgi:EKC/KEOPS complex subunit CGI121/TPRKB